MEQDENRKRNLRFETRYFLYKKKRNEAVSNLRPSVIQMYTSRFEKYLHLEKIENYYNLLVLNVSIAGKGHRFEYPALNMFQTRQKAEVF